MAYRLMYDMLCKIYAALLRDLLRRAVDDPDSDWDDLVLTMVDSLFRYVD